RRFGRDLHRALPDGVQPPVLPGRERRRRRPDQDRLRPGGAHQAPRRRAGRRRVSRVQPMMHTAEALKAFAPLRGDAIVVPGRGGRHWVELTKNEGLDAPMGDPAMGGHAGFAFGLALARPERKVVLFDSEGDILMSLGMLVTIAEQAPANFYHFMLDNEC